MLAGPIRTAKIQPVLCMYKAVTSQGGMSEGAIMIWCHHSDDIQNEFNFSMMTRKRCWVPWHGPKLVRWRLVSYLPQCEMPEF